MSRKFLTDEEVALEIERLKASEEVKIARKRQRLKYKYRQQLYTLRILYKEGKAMLDAGITSEKLDEMWAAAEAEDQKARQEAEDAALRVRLMALVDSVTEEDIDEQREG